MRPLGLLFLRQVVKRTALALPRALCGALFVLSADLRHCGVDDVDAAPCDVVLGIAAVLLRVEASEARPVDGTSAARMAGDVQRRA